MNCDSLIEEERSSLFEYDIARLSYIHNVCKRCSVNMMKKRECGLFKGHTLRSCIHMEKAINLRKAVKQAKSRINWAKEIAELAKEAGK